MGVTVTGGDQVGVRLRRMAKRAENIAPAGRTVGSYLSRVAREQFASSGTRLGRPWPPLKPRTLAWKIKHGQSRKPLVGTGALRASFASRPMRVEVYTHDELRFGSDLNTARWHHYGTHRHGKRVNPPRPILFVTVETRREVTAIIARYLVGSRSRSE